MARCGSLTRTSTTGRINIWVAAMMECLSVRRSRFARASCPTMGWLWVAQRTTVRRGCPAGTPSHPVVRASCLAAAILLAGCGGARTSPVEGRVLVDGKPVAGASIQFVPQGKGRDATGETDKDGQFVMSTF